MPSTAQNSAPFEKRHLACYQALVETEYLQWTSSDRVTRTARHEWELSDLLSPKGHRPLAAHPSMEGCVWGQAHPGQGP